MKRILLSDLKIHEFYLYSVVIEALLNKGIEIDDENVKIEPINFIGNSDSKGLFFGPTEKHIWFYGRVISRWNLMISFGAEALRVSPISQWVGMFHTLRHLNNSMAECAFMGYKVTLPEGYDFFSS